MANDIFFKNRFTLCFDVVGVLAREISTITKDGQIEIEQLLNKKSKDIVFVPKNQ